MPNPYDQFVSNLSSSVAKPGPYNPSDYFPGTGGGGGSGAPWLPPGDIGTPGQFGPQFHRNPWGLPGGMGGGGPVGQAVGPQIVPPAHPPQGVPPPYHQGPPGQTPPGYGHPGQSPYGHPGGGQQPNFLQNPQAQQAIMQMLQRINPQMAQQIQQTPGGFLAWLNQLMQGGQQQPVSSAVGPQIVPPAHQGM